MQVGLSGNLRECNNSSSIEIVTHKKVVELHYAQHKETCGTLQPVLHHGRSFSLKVRNNRLQCHKQINDDTLEVMTKKNRKHHISSSIRTLLHPFVANDKYLG